MFPILDALPMPVVTGVAALFVMLSLAVGVSFGTDWALGKYLRELNQNARDGNVELHALQYLHSIDSSLREMNHTLGAIQRATEELNPHTKHGSFAKSVLGDLESINRF